MQPSKGTNGEPEPMVKQQKGVDHIVSHIHRLSVKQYPPGCPPPRPQWFHAVDSPKRRPNPAGERKKPAKPAVAPKKYAAFSTKDSKTIEAAYRKLSQEQISKAPEHHPGASLAKQSTSHEQSSNVQPNLSLEDDLTPGKVRVPVNEDYLFDVDIERRELGPTYWLGPVYDVRRAIWFYQDATVQRPCDENLASQLEDGYLKVQAWKLPTTQATSKPRSNSQPRTRPTSWSAALVPSEISRPPGSAPMTPKTSDPDLRKQATDHTKVPASAGVNVPAEQPQNVYRLFGAHMNSIVTYQDATTAWLQTDDFMSRMNYNMYQRFAGGGHFGGIKMTRGYVRPVTTKSATESTEPSQPNESKDSTAASKRESSSETLIEEQQQQPASHVQRLQRQMSSLLEGSSDEDRAKQEEEIRKRDEREIEEDYREQDGEEQSREIEHLILVTHGIGQRLGLRIESVNFVHDINTFRKTIKAVYADSPDLKALNAELDQADAVNSRIQVLPICWRHLLDFPKQSLKHNRREQDLADVELDDEDYPSLEDISVEGVPAVRNLITDLALDILLYQSPAYKDHISRIVLEECNRIYHLFMDRNPDFKGKISLVGHSLGSAIMFDLLCRQGQHFQKEWDDEATSHLKLDFEVEDFYALGSPIGLFQMLKGRTIAARPSVGTKNAALGATMDDPMLDSAPLNKNKKARPPLDPVAGDVPVSSPQCAQIFNIFHPTDPISYRVEPLISPSMSSLKPQPLPYTKGGIFGASVGQGLTGIGARVGQSVSGLWSSMASSLLTRGLGYNGAEPATITNPLGAPKSSAPLSLNATASGGAGVHRPKAPLPAEGTKIAELNDKEVGSARLPSNPSDPHPPTLIDAEIETLFSGFEKRRKSVQGDAGSRDLGSGPLGDPTWREAEERGKRLRREEEKVRRLNSNGRVDYAIQEGVFDINLIAAIASHLSYWSDEDVSHFIISQLLSRHRVVRPSSSSGGAKPGGAGQQ